MRIFPKIRQELWCSHCSVLKWTRSWTNSSDSPSDARNSLHCLKSRSDSHLTRILSSNCSASLSCTARSNSGPPARSRRRYPRCHYPPPIPPSLLHGCYCPTAASPPLSLSCCSTRSIALVSELVSPPRHSAAACSHQEAPNPVSIGHLVQRPWRTGRKTDSDRSTKQTRTKLSSLVAHTKALPPACCTRRHHRLWFRAHHDEDEKCRLLPTPLESKSLPTRSIPLPPASRYPGHRFSPSYPILRVRGSVEYPLESGLAYRE